MNFIFLVDEVAKIHPEKKNKKTGGAD